jgi:hypothetical protein
MRHLIMIALVLSMSVACVAASDYYVRAGAAGANNGSDWNNAFTSLPSALVRGSTYYVAAGNYSAYTFDDPLSGSLVITIRKATASSHGAAAGWQAAYGSGQAVFNSTMWFRCGYYVFDGQTRNESDWFDGSSYGFRISHANQDRNIVIADYGVTISNVAIKYVYVDAIYGNLPTATTIRRYAIDTDGFDGGTTATNLLFHRMYVRGSNNVWFLRTTNGAIVEYSASDGAEGNSANHAEIVNLYYSGNNAILRYNNFRNAFINGGGTALVAITYADGLQFYGNVCSNYRVGDATVGFAGYHSSHNRVYNNTFVDGTRSYNSGTAWGSGTDNVTSLLSA